MLASNNDLRDRYLTTSCLPWAFITKKVADQTTSIRPTEGDAAVLAKADDVSYNENYPELATVAVTSAF